MLNCPKSGIILVDKKTGFSSQNAVSRVKHILKTKTAGHSGTLDPLASGLLIVCFGRATRIIEYLESKRKTYLVQISLGTETDTYDCLGKEVAHSEKVVSKEEFESVLKSFIGKQDQIPPVYSAIHLNGKRSYELARDGAKIELQARPIEIYSADLLSSDSEKGVFEFTVDCSKGTYIRSLCHDIGLKLGTYGMMSSLRRTRIGDYSVEDSYLTDQIMSLVAEQDYRFIMPTDSIFQSCPILHTDERGEIDVRNGVDVSSEKISEPLSEGRFRLYHGDSFLAIGTVENNCFHTEKNFYEI